MRILKVILIIVLFIGGIVGGVGSAELFIISIPRMLFQIAITFALIALIGHIEVYNLLLLYKDRHRTRKKKELKSNEINRYFSQHRRSRAYNNPKRVTGNSKSKKWNSNAV